MSLLRAALGRTGASRRDQFYQEGVPPLSSMPWVGWGGRGITQEDAVRMSAIHSCVRVLSTIATLPVGGFRRQGDARVPVPDPDWMRYPVPDDPSVTFVDHLTQVIWSMALDGNNFTLALPSVYEPAELHVVNPTKVTIRKRARYELTLDGGGRETVGPDQMIHVAMNRRGGDLRGISPVEQAGATFAMKKAAERFGERVFNQGVFLSGQMLLPGPAAQEVIDQLKAEITEQYAGAANAGKPGIFANGAKWDVPHLNLQEMQLVELHKMAKLEAAGLWGIPPYLIGITDPGAMAYGSVEAQGVDLEKYTFQSYIVRIEKGYDRLLVGTDTFVRINSAAILRGDAKSRAEAFALYLQNKVVTRGEVRTELDMPLFGDDRDGLLETPNNNPWHGGDFPIGAGFTGANLDPTTQPKGLRERTAG